MAGALLVAGASAAFASSALASTGAAQEAQATHADLAVFVSDGRVNLAGPGDETTYVITVTNAGPAAVAGATIENVLPPGLSGAVWGCLEQEDVSCSSKGSGDLGDQFDLPAGSSLTYLLAATLDEGAGTSVSNVVNVAPPADVVDPVAGNDRAVDVNAVGPALTDCDIPEAAKAIAANVTVTTPTAAGHIRVFAAGLASPEASNVNYASGRTRAAQAIVSLSSEGEIEVSSSQATGTAHLVLDVAGYFK